MSPWRLTFNRRIATVALHDVVMAALSFELAVMIRYITYGAPQGFGFLWEGTLIFTAVCALTFWRMGLYRGIWYYASLNDLIAIVKAVTLGILIFLPVMFVITRLENFPRTALFINWPLLVLMLSGPRFLYRALKDGNLGAAFERSDPNLVPVLLVGAGDEAEAFIREIGRSRHAGYRVVGIVDDRPGRQGRDIRGIRVMGSINDAETVIDDLARRGRRPQRLIVTSERFAGAAVSELLDLAERRGMTLARAPRITDLRSGELGHGQTEPLALRPVAVEDLLGRPQKVLDREAMQALVAGRRVLVTGAGGTIGSELARQVAALVPARLVLLDNGEHALYGIDLELGERFPELARSAVLGDVRDPGRLAAVFDRERPELVFHAAAFKHVPLNEQNPNEAVLTNALGTKAVADACLEYGAAVMVLISTDKAVEPSSVMGASKRLAEMSCQALADAPGPTRFVIVRFGNVLGSTGSVVPLFERQLARGGPLTVTDPEITRYFMTTREAVELVLQASAIPVEQAEGIFVLDMGEPVRIQDLARQMIRLAGFRPDKDVAITFTGLRPGEKLHERLFGDQEELVETRYEGILLTTPAAPDRAALESELQALAAAARARNTDDTLTRLAALVPDYRRPQ